MVGKNIFSVSWWFSQRALNAAETKKHLERTPSGGGSDFEQKRGVHKNLRKVLNLQVLNQEASKFDKDEGLLYLPRPLYQHRKQTR